MSIASCDSDDQGGLGAIASLRSREGRRRAERRQIFISLEYGAGLTCGTHPIAVVVVFVPVIVALAVLVVVILFLLPLLLALVPTARAAVSFLVTGIPLIVVLQHTFHFESAPERRSQINIKCYGLFSTFFSFHVAYTIFDNTNKHCFEGLNGTTLLSCLLWFLTTFNK